MEEQGLRKLTCRNCGISVEPGQICACKNQCIYCGEPWVDTADSYLFEGSPVCESCARQIAYGFRKCIICNAWHQPDEICRQAKIEYLCSSACREDSGDYPCGASATKPPPQNHLDRCWKERGNWREVLR